MTIPDTDVWLKMLTFPLGFWGQLIGLAAGPLLGKLFGSKNEKRAGQVAGTLVGEGGAYGGMAKGLIGDATKGFNTVGGYLNPLVSGDPNALAQWTATTNADEARRTQQIARQAGAGARSGATASATLGALQGQRSAALANRINARMTATQALTDLSSRQGSLGLGAGGLSLDAYRSAGGIYGNLAGNETQRDLGQGGMWSDIGGGLMDVLSGEKAKGGNYGGLGGLFGKIFGKKSNPIGGVPGTTNQPFGNIPPPTF